MSRLPRRAKADPLADQLEPLVEPLGELSVEPLEAHWPHEGASLVVEEALWDKALCDEPPEDEPPPGGFE